MTVVVGRGEDVLAPRCVASDRPSLTLLTEDQRRSLWVVIDDLFHHDGEMSPGMGVWLEERHRDEADAHLNAVKSELLRFARRRCRSVGRIG